jgi:hypothetical protein
VITRALVHIPLVVQEIFEVLRSTPDAGGWVSERERCMAVTKRLLERRAMHGGDKEAAREEGNAWR